MKDLVEYTSKNFDITTAPREVLSPWSRIRVLGYLRHRDFLIAGVSGNFLIDAFTGDKMPATGTCFTDGKWKWRDDLWLYVRDYDIALPPEFIDDVISFYKHGGTDPVPCMSDITISDLDQYEKHHKGRRLDWIWNDVFEMQLGEVPCICEISLLPFEVHWDSQKVFYPLVIYIEDAANYDNKNIIYIKARYRLWAEDGKLELAEEDDTYVDSIKQIISEHVSNVDLLNKARAGLTNDYRKGIPVDRS